MTGNEVFLQCVSPEFLKVFVNATIYSDLRDLKQNATYAIHEWGTKHTYVNGKVSEFYNTWEKLKKAKIKVPEIYLDPNTLAKKEKKQGSNKKSSYKRSPNKEAAYIDESKDMVLSIYRTMNKWKDDKKLFDEIRADIGYRKKKLNEMSLTGNKEAAELEKVMKSLPTIMSRVQNNDVKAKLDLIEISKGFTSTTKNSSMRSEESLKKSSVSTKKANSPEVTSSLKRSIRRSDDSIDAKDYTSNYLNHLGGEVSQADIRKLERKVDQLTKERAELKRMYSKIEEQNEELARRYDDASKEFRQDSADNQKSITELKKSLATKRIEFNSKKGTMDSDLMEQELDFNKKQWKQLNETLYSAEREIDSMKEENAILTASLENLAKQERELKQKIELIKRSPVKTSPIIRQPEAAPLNAPMFSEEKKEPIRSVRQSPQVQPTTPQQIVRQEPVVELSKSPVPQPIGQVPPREEIKLSAAPMGNAPPLPQSVQQIQTAQADQAPPAFVSQQTNPPEVRTPPAASPTKPESPSEVRYKNCLTSLSGVWHEDSTILVTISRSVNVPMKSAAFKITFENKLADTTLHIKGLDLLSFDTNGIITN